jgi:hypothetical protein
VATFRRRLSWTVCAWLCCQLSLLTATPLSLLADSMHTAADAITCTCGHSGNAECPMHHSKPVKRGCECRGTTDPGADALLSMLGPIAVLAETPTVMAPADITTSPNHQITRFLDTVFPPTAPPPRA